MFLIFFHECSWLHDSKETLANSKSNEQGGAQLKLRVAAMTEFCQLLYTKKDPSNGGASVLEMLAFASFRCGAPIFTTRPVTRTVHQ